MFTLVVQLRHGTFLGPSACATGQSSRYRGDGTRTVTTTHFPTSPSPAPAPDQTVESLQTARAGPGPVPVPVLIADGRGGDEPALTSAIVAVSALNTLAQRFWACSESSWEQVQTMTRNARASTAEQAAQTGMRLCRHGRETGRATTLRLDWVGPKVQPFAISPAAMHGYL